MPTDFTNKVNADSDAADVTHCRTLFVDTSAATVTLGGLSGGVSGQVLSIVKTDASNNLVFEHQESSGTQKFYFEAAADRTITAVKGSVTFVFDGTDWCSSY